MDKRFVVAVIAVAASVAVLSAALQEPVQTDAGLIAAAKNSPDGVRVFRGIPFGAPPVGALRWKPTQPRAKWDGVRPGVASATSASSRRRGTPERSVDTPDSPATSGWPWSGAARANERRPVMV
jgi:para-nitrobenzyl esterase